MKIETFQKPIILCAAYRPPNSKLPYLQQMGEDFKAIASKYKKTSLWFGGDFNLPDIDWNMNLITNHQNTKIINETFLQIVNDLNLEQLVNFPTRNENYLDLILTNNPSLVTCIDDLPGISDHTSIASIDILCHPRRIKSTPRTIYLWGRANVKQLKESLAEKVNSFCENSINDPVENQWSEFKDIVKSTMEEIPSKLSSPRFNQPWFSRKCNRLSKKTKRTYRRAKRTRMCTDWERYKSAFKDYKKECKAAHDKFLQEKVFHDEANPKKFYSYIKSKRQDSTSVSALKNDNGVFVIDDSAKANILNQQYCSVFSVPDKNNPKIETTEIKDKMPDITISSNGIESLLNRIKPNKAPGPDDIASRFLREFSNELTPALKIIFSTSLDKGELPKDWLHARISPVYKGGNKDRCSPENYRPISLTSICCKILEHVIYSNIIKHLNKHNAITEVQHGFREKRSCESQLLITINDFAKALNNGDQMDTILLDFSKAFDKVEHRKLCLKLEHYGIKGQCLDWIKSFLSGRTQEVILNGKSSEKSKVTSGVPQGTVLGPLLFLVYINDMPSVVLSLLRLFADDAYLYRVIKSNHDAFILQQDLDRLQAWEKDFNMEFHPKKCKVLSVTNKTKPLKTSYKIHNETLESVDSAKYLGVEIHKKLKWKVHVANICKKSNQIINFLQRNLRGCTRSIKTKAYNIYVKPILNYASSVWNPVNNDTLTKQLEQVQRKAARFVNSDWSWNSSPSSMINDLGWESLESCRKRNNLLMFHKIINERIVLPQDFLPKRARIDNKFQKVHGRVLAYSNSFIPITTDWWNKLPSEVTMTKNQTEFLKELHTNLN